MSANLADLELPSRPGDTPRCVLPAGRDAAAWYAAFTAQIAATLGPAHANLFARPSVVDTQIVWHAAGVRMKRFAELSTADRRTLTAAISAILSDIRRLGESGAAPAVAAAWPALREIPDLDCVFAVDGRPVLAAWGHIGGRAEHPPGLLARFDDQLPWAPPHRPPARALLFGAGALGALALAAGLLLPFAGALLSPTVSQCVADPAGLGLIREAREAVVRKDGLEDELSRLEEERGRSRIACPLPTAPPPPAPTPAAAPVPPPTLPKEGWDRGDLAMLDGCWRNTTDMSTLDEATGKISGVLSWQMCFDRNGTGKQDIVWKDGVRCQGPLRVRFQGGKMVISEPARCNGPRRLRTGLSECTRLTDNEAECARTQNEGPGTGNVLPGRFRR